MIGALVELVVFRTLGLCSEFIHIVRRVMGRWHHAVPLSKVGRGHSECIIAPASSLPKEFKSRWRCVRSAFCNCRTSIPWPVPYRVYRSTTCFWGSSLKRGRTENSDPEPSA